MSGTGKARDWQASGFTLVELVIAITVLAILGGLAVPAIDSVQRERLAREPVNQLYLLAREVRVQPPWLAELAFTSPPRAAGPLHTDPRPAA